MKLLLVEDEEELSRIVAKGLRKCSYAVDTAYNGEEALSCFEINDYDLIILDLNLPKLDGLSVLQEIRAHDESAKVLILSARSEIEDRVRGLDLGANDYLIKPFDFMELEARVRALLRASFTQTPAVLACGGVRLDMRAKTVSADGTMINFTKKEYGILEYLLLNKERIVSAEQLVEHVWDSEADLFSNSLKFHIHSIKKKLGAFSECADRLRNIRGQGYAMMEDNNEITK